MDFPSRGTARHRRQGAVVANPRGALHCIQRSEGTVVAKAGACNDFLILFFLSSPPRPGSSVGVVTTRTAPTVAEARTTAPAQPVAHSPPAASGDGRASPARRAKSSTLSKTLVLYLSSDDSNSMASPVRAARRFDFGRRSPPDRAVRTYEFLNYFHIDFPAPEKARSRIHTDARPPRPRPGSSPADRCSLPDPGAQRGGVDPHVRRSIRRARWKATAIQRARAAMLALASRLQEGDVVNVGHLEPPSRT